MAICLVFLYIYITKKQDAEMLLEFIQVSYLVHCWYFIL